MRVGLLSAPWCEAQPTAELTDACSVLGDNVWREAAVDFYALRAARLKRGLSAPKGMQGQLNRVIESRFRDAGWFGAEGRFVKNGTWVRVTFRHQMSLGSDILDAAKVCAMEGCVQASILAGESGWLRLVSPNDYRALVTFEKLRIAVAELQGVLKTPLYIGSLRGQSELPEEISTELGKNRPRDTTIPTLFDRKKV